MAITSSSERTERRLRRPWRGAVAALGLLTAFLLPSGTDNAAADAQESVGQPAAKPPELPAAPNRVGRIRRDENGNIVPDGPPLPPDENATRPKPPDYFPAPPPSTISPSPYAPGNVGPYDTSYLETLQNRQAHAQRAHARQAEIDRILREEAIAGGTGGGRGLTAREAALVRELKRTDEEIRLREMRRYTLAQPYAAHPEFWFVSGPRGRRYAASGMTRLDAAMIDGDPAATLRKLETLRRAVLAPLAPSPEDYPILQELNRLILVLRRRPYGFR